MAAIGLPPAMPSPLERVLRILQRPREPVAQRRVGGDDALCAERGLGAARLLQQLAELDTGANRCCSLTALIGALMMKLGSRAYVASSLLLVLSLLDGRRMGLRRLSLGISQTGACMHLRAMIFGLPLLAIAAVASAVTLPGDYGAVDIDTALKKSAADGKLIMLFVAGVG